MLANLQSSFRSLRPWVWAAAVGFALLFCIIAAGLVMGLRTAPPEVVATADVLAIPAPTPTKISPFDLLPTPTATPSTVMLNGIGMGVYVQISGTDGDGLRLRSGPGTENASLFLGMDSEVFLVKDGPRSSEGIVWWYLVAPYDEKRAGWAAATYLSVVSTQP